MSDDQSSLWTLAQCHASATTLDKLQAVAADVADHMGAFEETALDADDALASIFDREVHHG
ncbi:MAG: hypothetical protein HRT36_06080 [Alphaproteobacteria bacterium]|nr:hypothetical protein [Alphaproteobacteria bacterium]